MNRDPLKKFFKKTYTVGLDEKKKGAIHQEVLVFMKKHPLQEEVAEKRWFGFFVSSGTDFRFKTPAIVLAGLMLFLLVGGITSVSADSALPGDFLYPMKLGFNEKIKETLAFSDEAKINLHITLAKTRLREAEKLMMQGRINNTNVTQIHNNFKDHLNTVTDDIKKLHDKKMYQQVETLSTRLEASLRAHEQILDSLQNNSHEKVFDSLIKEIKDTTSKAAGTRMDLNNSIFNTTPMDTVASEISGQNENFQKKVSAIEDSLIDIKKLLLDKKNKIGQDAVTQSENNLDLIRQKLDEGKNKLSEDKNDYRSSIAFLQEASIIAQESKDLINEKAHLKANISIDIEARNNTANQNNENDVINATIPILKP